MMGLCHVCGRFDLPDPEHRPDGHFLRCSGCGLIVNAAAPQLVSLARERYEEARYFERYERRFVEKGSAAPSRLWVVRLVVPGGRLMDAGCGVGSRLVAAREMGSDVVGVDISSLPIVRCRRMGFAVYRACVTATGFSSFRSDAVTFCNVIGHIPAMAQGSGEVPRILRPGGVAAKLGPNANYLKARLGRHSCRNYPRSVV